MTSPFDPWIRRWALTPDGAEITTHAARILPVLQGNRPAMLKLATSEEERRGAEVLRGLGPGVAAEVYALDGPALLMARGGTDLTGLSLSDDRQATAVLCTMAAKLHAPGPRPPALTDLKDRFKALTGPKGRARFPGEAAQAEALLASSGAPTVLHGDLHHGNILRFGQDWRVIDPKGLWGDPCFEYVQMFFNPDAIDRSYRLAIRPQTFRRRLAQVSQAANLDPRRLCGWIAAHAALSQCWANPGDDITLVTTIAALAQTR